MAILRDYFQTGVTPSANTTCPILETIYPQGQAILEKRDLNRSELELLSATRDLVDKAQSFNIGLRGGLIR